MSKYEFDTISNFSSEKWFIIWSFNFLLYGVKIANFLTLNFFNALIAAELGVVSFAFGFAALTFFSIDSKPAAIVPDVQP